MIRHTVAPLSDSTEDERSMRVVEWALAFVAMIVAAVLAFVR